MTQQPAKPWIFGPVGALSGERLDQWVQTCHHRTILDELLADPNRSVVILSAPGDGLSTALALLPRSRILTIEYSPDRWPGQRQAFTRAEDHFSQWMGLLARRLRTLLSDDPSQSKRLRVSHHEFLAWIIRKYLGVRQGSLWLSRLQDVLDADDWAAVNATIESGELDESYNDDGSGIDGQIHESLDLVRRLDFRGIFATIDISWHEWVRRDRVQRLALREGVQQLLTTLLPLQQRGFGIKVGLPPMLGLSVAELEFLVRGRATVADHSWDESDVLAIARRMALTASDGVADTEPWLRSAYWPTLRADLHAIWGRLGPAAARALARAVVEYSPHANPDDAAAHLLLRRRMYELYAPLQIDNDLDQRTIWRGMQPINLEDSPFKCFLMLWEKRGHPVDTQLLKNYMGSAANLDKNISRIRQRIEPFVAMRDYLYVQREISRGIWLEHFSGPAVGALPPTA